MSLPQLLYMFMASFRSVIQEGICLSNLVTVFSIFILAHPQEEVWPDGQTHFGQKNILCIDHEDQVSFCLVLYRRTHMSKNQEECDQMWSGMDQPTMPIYLKLKEQKK